ncbi:hypothetical protein SB861_15465 [Paraburkholderia sp. SIMBA_049]
MENYRLSKWTYDTSASVSIGLGVAAISGGLISLKDPNRKAHHFHYGGFGVGASAGFSLTKIKLPEAFIRNYAASGSGSTTDFPGSSVLYMTDSFHGHELAMSDIQGVAAYVEVGAGSVASASGTLMFLGLNPLLIMAAVASPGFAHLVTIAIQQAPAVLFMWGASVAPQVGGGINALLGQLH